MRHRIFLNLWNSRPNDAPTSRRRTAAPRRHHYVTRQFVLGRFVDMSRRLVIFVLGALSALILAVKYVSLLARVEQQPFIIFWLQLKSRGWRAK